MTAKKAVETPNAEPFEHYQAFRHGTIIDEGSTPIPDDIRGQATEIRWSNPSVDKNARIDVPAGENMKRTAPGDFLPGENAERHDANAAAAKKNGRK